MSNKPKQWGPHASPEGLGKLRTAIATLPGQSHVSVSGPGFTGKKAGDYREVTSFDPEVPPKALPPDELFSTGGDVPFGPPVTKGSPLDAKGFHKVKGSYGMQIARSVFYLDTSPPSVSNLYQQNYIDRSGRKAEYRFWYRHGTHTGKMYKSLSNPIVQTSLGWGTTMLSEVGTRLLSSGKFIGLGSLEDGSYGMLWLMPQSGSPFDIWGFPTSTFLAISCVVDENGEPRYSSQVLPIPSHPSGVGNTILVAYTSPAPGEVILIVGRYPPDFPGDGSSVGGEVEWEWTGGEVSGIITKVVQYENATPLFWTIKSKDFGETWSPPVPFTSFHTTTPAYYYKGYDHERSAQPLIGLWPVMFGVGDPISNPPQTCQGEFTPPRIDYLSLSSLVASSPDNLILFTPIYDRRDYVGVDEKVNWRSVVFRSNDGGVTWYEVETPFTSLASEAPAKDWEGGEKNAEGGVHFLPHVVRKGVIIVRCAKGLQSHKDRDLGILRSKDHGVTWEEVVPVGVPFGKSHRFGHFSNVLSPSGKPLLAVTAWDGAKYNMYTSDDDGDTWKKAGRVHRPGGFSNMDYGQVTAPENVTSLSFGVVRYIPRNPTLPFNPGVPWQVDGRYSYDDTP